MMTVQLFKGVFLQASVDTCKKIQKSFALSDALKKCSLSDFDDVGDYLFECEFLSYKSLELLGLCDRAQWDAD